MPNRRPHGPTTQDDSRFIAIVLIEFLENLLRTVVSAVVREAVLEAADNFAQRPLVYTADQAAQVMQVSRRTVEMWVADEVLPRMPHTGRLLIPRAAIEAWVDDTVRRAAKP